MCITDHLRIRFRESEELHLQIWQTGNIQRKYFNPVMFCVIKRCSRIKCPCHKNVSCCFFRHQRYDKYKLCDFFFNTLLIKRGLFTTCISSIPILSSFVFFFVCVYVHVWINILFNTKSFDLTGDRSKWILVEDILTPILLTPLISVALPILRKIVICRRWLSLWYMVWVIMSTVNLHLEEWLIPFFLFTTYLILHNYFTKLW